jgi:hypothetical protein
MDTLEEIRNAIRSMKAEASGENRPHVNKKFVDDMIESYKRLTYVDLSDADRDRTIGMLRTVWAIKRFIELGELQQAQPYLHGLVSSMGE